MQFTTMGSLEYQSPLPLLLIPRFSTTRTHELDNPGDTRNEQGRTTCDICICMTARSRWRIRHLLAAITYKGSQSRYDMAPLFMSSTSMSLYSTSTPSRFCRATCIFSGLPRCEKRCARILWTCLESVVNRTGRAY